jgi:hypothetical protein
VLQTAASGVARFDHNPTTFESLGLLIEESRTNLLTYSEEFNNAAWTKSRSSITANTIVAPDGTLTGDKLVEDTTATSTHQATRTFNAVSGTTYTATIYAKAAERGFAGIGLGDGAFGATNIVTINLSTGATSVISGTATAASTFVGNGWYRVSVTATATSTETAINRIYASNSGTTVSYTGDGYSGIYIWGAQLEAGAFPTSYIPTVASQVTRSADAASMTGANFTSFYNAAEGTIYFESKTAQGSNAYPYSLFGTSTANRIFANYETTDRMQSGIRVANVFEVAVPTPNNSAPLNTFGKGATAYKVNDFGFSWNGAAALTDTSTNLPVVQKLDIGNNGGLAGNFLNGTIKKIAYYPIRCTNAQLVALTS